MMDTCILPSGGLGLTEAVAVIPEADELFQAGCPRGGDGDLFYNAKGTVDKLS